jgi:hypothetical protein
MSSLQTPEADKYVDFALLNSFGPLQNRSVRVLPFRWASLQHPQVFVFLARLHLLSPHMGQSSGHKVSPGEGTRYNFLWVNWRYSEDG